MESVDRVDIVREVMESYGKCKDRVDIVMREVIEREVMCRKCRIELT